MGIYYLVICENKKEYFESEHSVKFCGMCCPDSIFGHVLTFLMCTHWSNEDICMIDDCSDFYYEVIRGYKDISKEYYDKWKEYFKEELKDDK